MAEAPDNCTKVEDTLISRVCAREQTFLKGINLLEAVFVCVFSVTFPFTPFSNIKLSFLFMPPFLLIESVFISVCRRSGEQRLLCDCQSLSVYICK